jgi:DeoR/GlpR family transcriptional regulator of sugar metabolism
VCEQMEFEHRSCENRTDCACKSAAALDPRDDRRARPGIDRRASERAGVSQMTIRSDLDVLERAGALRRVHGGAISVLPVSYELPFSLREDRRAEAKARIGALAASPVGEGKTAVIDTAFPGAGAVDREAGVTEFNLDDACAKRTALAWARRCVLLADMTKLGKVAFARVCPLDRVDVLVAGGKREGARSIREAGWR